MGYIWSVKILWEGERLVTILFGARIWVPLPLYTPNLAEQLIFTLGNFFLHILSIGHR